jgi:hypothetical protein
MDPEEPLIGVGRELGSGERSSRQGTRGGPLVGGVVRAHHNGPPARPHAPAAANSPAVSGLMHQDLID